MKRTRLFVAAMVFGSLAATYHVPSFAQGGDSPGNGAVVVLDVAKVFKENTAFNKQIEVIQEKAKTLKNEVESQQQQLQMQAQQMAEQYKIGSPERKTAEADLEQKMTTLRTYARQSETELMTAEAKVYYDTYQLMQGIVARAANEHNIAMVLRYDSSDPDSNERGEVISLVNRAIIFQSNSDITEYVVGEMAKVQTASAPAAAVNQ